MNYTTGPGETQQDKNAVDRRTIEMLMRETSGSSIERFIELLAERSLSIEDLTDMERGVLICRYIASEAQNDSAEVLQTMSAQAEDAFLRHMGQGDVIAASAVFLESAGQAPYTSDVLNHAAARYESRSRGYSYDDYLNDQADQRVTEQRENSND